MTTQSLAYRFTIHLSVFCVLLFVTMTAAAQQAHLADSQDKVREFRNQDGDVFVTGVLYDVTGGDVAIAAGDGSTQTFNIGKFSDDDRIWIRKTVSEHKKYEKKKDAADKVIEELRSVRSSKIIKACRKLKSYGSAASHAGPRLQTLFQSQDDKVVLAAFICFSNTAKRNQDSINRLVRELMNPKSKVLRVVNERPKKFLETLPRYEDIAVPYLRAVAYNCKLDTQPVKHSADPEKLTLTSGAKNELRVKACQTLAKIKLDVSSEILLRILKVSDDGPVNQRDENTIQKTIEALGELGLNNGEVVDSIKRYESEFPEVVKASLEKLN